MRRNAQHSATLLETSLSKLASINKTIASTTVNNSVLSESDFSNMNAIREMIHIKHNFANMTLYSKEEIDFYWSIVVQAGFFLCCYACVLCMKFIINK